MRGHQRPATARSARRSIQDQCRSAFASCLGALLLALAIPAGAAAAPSLLWHSPLDSEAGSAAGRLDNPGAIAADPTTGHLYIGDRFNNSRISEFDAWGEFIKAWGWGVADGAPELETCGPGATPPTATCQQGIAGSGAGQLTRPKGGIAVDGAGNIYVGDMDNARIQKFDPEGNFLLMFGKEVDKGPNHTGDVCTAAYIVEEEICGAGTVGSGNGQFGTNGFKSNFIAIGPAGTVFVGDKGRIQEFEPNGTYKGAISLEGELAGQDIASLAIDAAGNFYLTAGFYQEAVGHKVHKLSPAGAPLATFPVGLTAESSIALDGSGNLYVTAQSSDGEHREIVEFGPSGAPIIPVGEGFEKRGGIFGPEGTALGFGGLATNTVTAAGGGDVYVTVGGYSGPTQLAFASAYGPPPDKWAPPKFAPEILSQYAASVEADGATLRAQINPRFWADTTYYAEYGTGKCSEGGCTSLLPAPPGSQLGAGIVNASITTTSIILKDLSPGTTYHYRFVAQSSGGGPVHGVGVGEAEGAFTTQSVSGPPNTNCANQAFRIAASAQLPDCRAYEMVSPVEKNNIDIAPLINIRSNRVFLNQSAKEGSALTYTTSQGFGDAQGVPYLSQYLSRRTKDGWTNHGITSPRGLSRLEAGRKLEPEFRAFTSDLCSGALQHSADPPLAPGGIEGFLNLYRRHNCGEEGYEALTTTVPPNLGLRPEGSFFQPDVQGFTADGDCTVFRANDQLTPDASPGKPEAGTNFQVYESCGGELHLISVLPNGTASPAGSAGTAIGKQDGSLETRDFRAVSTDGSRVYWTAAWPELGQLFVRVNATQEQSKISNGKCTEEEKACTLKVSQTVTSEKAEFLGAAEDGSKAFFRITEGPLSNNLYEFDLESKKATLIAGQIMGFMGVGRDASRAYFLSKEVLAAPNAEAKSPIAGQPNLYLYESSEGGSAFNFIATLAGSDTALFDHAFSPVHAVPFKHTSRLSPDGRQVAFTSSASLTGYDNTDVESGEADVEVFTYDAGAGKLSCVSCNPSGVRPSGESIELDGSPTDNRFAALLPPFTTELYGTRVITDDGSRIFFNSYEALLPHDTNGKIDVYEWEKPGSGDCTEASSAFSPPNDGCLSLISSGESPSDSEFIDASADGTDVFIATASSLLPQDPGLIDIYDARAGGGYPALPVPPASCEGEACQGPLAPPNDPTPASSAFEGAGNVKAEKKAHKKKAHKKKSAKKHAAKKNKRANNKGRAGR
jgi:hypothetical protein